MFFVLSKIFHFFTFPGVWILLFIILSYFFTNKKWKKWFFRAGVVLALFFTNTFIFKEFVRLWETEGIRTEDLSYHDVAIVLGGMAEYNHDLERLSLRRGGDRIWQTLLLYHQGKVGKILLAGDEGYVVDRGLNEALRFREELIKLKVRPEDILIDSLSKNTYENAVNSVKVLEQYGLKKGKIVLVTSAVHMKRARACFRLQGVEVTPYPTDHYTGPGRSYHWDEYILPSFSTLLDWYALTHEWFGYIAYSVAGYL